MAEKKTWTDEKHYRITSGDGSRSWLYEADSKLFGLIKNNHLIEVADHLPDGQTYSRSVD